MKPARRSEERAVSRLGTLLPGSERKTNQWFGDYVSEYNFQLARVRIEFTNHLQLETAALEAEHLNRRHRHKLEIIPDSISRTPEYGGM
ncbi:MAG TPA: hypothetical protein VNN22_06670 [Verrucomicrobiae bacterium]|nr:hypothetical protein [Verrucomicrobiae bacterium]